jgi:NAD(P)-dependent dehydrogenase (short-subunit alcohol dehydrogenase family)
VVIAEIDARTGQAAADTLNAEHGAGTALFVTTDVGDLESVSAMARRAFEAFGKVDVVINNATAFKMGPVTDVPVGSWDLAYRVNIRGPVLLAQAFLPGMIGRDHGTFVCISSSGAAPFMGAYEVFKTAQVELARVLDGEMEGKKVNVFTIGPGLAKTPGSEEGIRTLAPLYNKTVEEFYALSKEVLLTAEEAGAGFAAAVALADKFRGQEISSHAALHAIGITIGKVADENNPREIPWARALPLAEKACSDLEEQYKGWMEMVVFKRQWILRDFKKGAGMPVEQWLDSLRSLREAIRSKDRARVESLKPPFDKLSAQYSHMLEMLNEYEKDRAKLEEGRAAILGWITTINELNALLGH